MAKAILTSIFLHSLCPRLRCQECSTQRPHSCRLAEVSELSLLALSNLAIPSVSYLRSHVKSSRYNSAAPAGELNTTKRCTQSWNFYRCTPPQRPAVMSALDWFLCLLCWHKYQRRRCTCLQSSTAYLSLLVRNKHALGLARGPTRTVHIGSWRKRNKRQRPVEREFLSLDCMLRILNLVRRGAAPEGSEPGSPRLRCNRDAAVLSARAATCRYLAVQRARAPSDAPSRRPREPAIIQQQDQ